MVAVGLPDRVSDHAQAAIEMAMAMQCHLETMRAEHPELRLHIGIHTGPVIAGVIGDNAAGRIQVTEPLARAVVGTIGDDAHRYLSRLGGAAVADSQGTAYYDDMPILGGGHGEKTHRHSHGRRRRPRPQRGHQERDLSRQ